MERFENSRWEGRRIPRSEETRFRLILPGSLSGSGDGEEPRGHWLCDTATEWLLYAMVVFSPWAFGTTQPWSRQVMDVGGYLLGGLLAAKWIIRRVTGWRPTGRTLEERTGVSRAGIRRWPTRLLAGLTVLILGYCLVSVLNARATYVRSEYRLAYHTCVPWLPHTYDTVSTWSFLANYLALALAFWAARDWMLGGGDRERGGRWEEFKLTDRPREGSLPKRLRRLLWVICVNGALLALEGILQRTSGVGKLLWLVEPHINKEAAAQFGPYAYRSNAAQYFTLIWPVALGLWWVRQRAAKHQRRPRTTHHLLLPCAMLVAACPLVSLSRAGAIVGLGGILIAVAILLFTRREMDWRVKTGLLLFLVAILTLGWYVEWPELSKRFATGESLSNSERVEMWRNGLQIARDFPVFGTGPGTFSPIYQYYRGSVDQYWPAQLHNDWLETLITFGWVGSALILLALLAAAGRWFFPGGIVAHRVFVMFLWLALGGGLAHAAVDFPFQIYSIMFLFLLLCAVLSCLSREA